MNPVEVREYVYAIGQPGPLLRKTQYQYLHDAQPAYLDRNIVDKPTSVIVSDGNGMAVSQTSFEYDNYTAANMQMGVSGASAHDPVFTTAFTTRGNLTATMRWDSANNTFVTERSQYDDVGNVIGTMDALGHKTTIAYGSNWTNAACAAPLATQAYPTSVTDALQHTSTHSYYSCSGLLASTTDINGQTASASYDMLGRMKSISHPDTGSKVFCYGEDPNGGCAEGRWITTESVSTGTSGGPIIRKSVWDGFGNLAQTQLTSDPQGTTYEDLVSRSDGRVLNRSQPYRSGGAGQVSFTSFEYDGLGRSTTTTNPDSSQTAQRYTGLITESTDERHNTWTRTSDSLGRLAKVQEPSGGGSSGALTRYEYDLLGNLKTVVQEGASGESSRTRSFTYSSLSRLITASSPETGTICYGTWSNNQCGSGYDANDNLLAKTDARGAVTTYSYDALNRPTSKSRSGGSIDSYYYDGNVGPWAGTQLLGGNLIGRLSFTRSWNPDLTGGTCNPTDKKCDDQYLGYDSMGRLNHAFEATPSEWGFAAHSTDAHYDLAGNLDSVTYPDGRSVASSYDAAGRLTSVGDGTHTYLNSTSYWPSGAVHSMNFADGLLFRDDALNSRLQTCIGAYGSTGHTLLERRYFYGTNSDLGHECDDVAGNNGNILHVLDGINSNNGQHYTYDSLNRLTAWTGTSPTGDYRHISMGYDSFGNKTQTGSQTAIAASSVYGADNRLLPSQVACQGRSGETGGYDASGNVVCTGSYSAMEQKQFVWDAESRMTQFWNQQHNNPYLAGLYTYDAGGQRVRSDNPTAQTWREYTYFNGQVLAEKDQDGHWTDHIYAGGQRLATVGGFGQIHLHGQRDAEHVNMGCGTNWWQSGMGGYQYTVRAGDRLMWDQRNVNATGGLDMLFTDNTGIGAYADEAGVGIETMGPSGDTWVHRVFDLGSYFVGKTIAGYFLATNNSTPATAYDQFYQDVTIVSADGQVTPGFNGQQPVQSGGYWDGCGIYNGSFAVEQVPSSINSTQGVRYHAADQVGTAQMLFSGTGTPVWRGEFAPFGEEITDPNASGNRYKFTGKERDTESGLDYFGARYYSANAGRWMSPDWSDKPEAVPYSDLTDPQSLNLYGYVRNNPLNRADADGHDEDGWFSKAVDFVGGIGRGATQSFFPTSANGPSPNDSMSSLSGQLTGSGIVGVLGTDATVAGGGMVVGGGVAAPVTGGASLAISAEGAALAGAGVVVTKGAATNASAVAQAMGAHGNTAGNQPAELYEKTDKDGNLEKHGVSQDASKRYSKAEIGEGKISVTDRGPRKEMLAKERHKVETNPGPKNREPWAGKKRDQ